MGVWLFLWSEGGGSGDDVMAFVVRDLCWIYLLQLAARPRLVTGDKFFLSNITVESLSTLSHPAQHPTYLYLFPPIEINLSNLTSRNTPKPSRPVSKRRFRPLRFRPPEPGLAASVGVTSHMLSRLRKDSEVIPRCCLRTALDAVDDWPVSSLRPGSYQGMTGGLGAWGPYLGDWWRGRW